MPSGRGDRVRRRRHRGSQQVASPELEAHDAGVVDLDVPRQRSERAGERIGAYAEGTHVLPVERVDRHHVRPPGRPHAPEARRPHPAESSRTSEVVRRQDPAPLPAVDERATPMTEHVSIERGPTVRSQDDQARGDEHPEGDGRCRPAGTESDQGCRHRGGDARMPQAEPARSGEEDRGRQRRDGNQRQHRRHDQRTTAEDRPIGHRDSDPPVP